MDSKDSKKRVPGRPRVHEVGKWSSVQFRIPVVLRETLYKVLADKNDTLAYRLSLNSLLLELIELGLKVETAIKTPAAQEPSDAPEVKHIHKVK